MKVELSASQVETFDATRDGCERKWGIRYLSKVRVPPDPSAQLGSRVHEICEAWLRDGTAPPVDERLELPDRYAGKFVYYPGQIFMAGIQHFPAPRTVTVEGRFKFATNVLGLGEVNWQGAKDAAWVDAHGVPVVADLKTTKDFRYMKTAEILATDTQANLYAWEAMERHGTQVAIGRWVTVHTRKPEARPVTRTFSRPEVAAQMGRIERVAHKILTLYRERPDSSELPAQTATCPKFGGCAYQNTEHCKLTVSAFFSSDFDSPTQATQGDDMDFTSFIKEKFPGAAPPPPAVVAAPPPAALPATPPPPVMAAPPPPPVSAHPHATPDALRAISAAGEALIGGGVAEYWRPGDPENLAQESLRARGASLDIVAQAADIPPPVGTVYDVINSPEAPEFAPSCPEEMPPVESVKKVTCSDDLDSLGREDLKALAIQLGACDKSYRGGPDSLRDRIRAKRAENADITPEEIAAVKAEWAEPPPPITQIEVTVHPVTTVVTAAGGSATTTESAVVAAPPPPAVEVPRAERRCVVGSLPWIVLDLETTGLRPHADVILECAAIAVDPNTLQELGRFHALVRSPLPAGIDPYVIDMHSKNGLWSELARSKSALTTEELHDELATWLHTYGKGAKLSLAGNSVHFDLSFLRALADAWSPIPGVDGPSAPNLGAQLSHRVVDCSSFREALRAWSTVSSVEPAHRAMADAESSLRQLREFRGLITATNAKSAA